MRVCFVTSEFPPQTGGISRSANRIVTLLAQSGFEMHVVAPSEGIEEVPMTELPCGARLYRVPWAPKRQISGLPPQSDVWLPAPELLQSIDRAVSFDLFHGFELQNAYPCLCVAEGRPVIASFRGIDVKRLLTDPNRELGHKILTAASWITSVSSDALVSAMELVDIRGRSSFLPNSVDSSEFTRWALEARNAGVVGTVAVFRRKKNIPLLIRAYSSVPARLRRKLLLIGGDKHPGSPDAQEIQVALRDSLLGKEVMVTGYVDPQTVRRYLTGMRVFVLSSLQEGLPNAVLEAAAAGVPIVATAVDGIKDIFEHNRSALLMPPNDQTALTLAISRVLSDDRLARTLSKGGKQVAADLNPGREREAWKKLYVQLTTAGPHRARDVKVGTSIPPRIERS